MAGKTPRIGITGPATGSWGPRLCIAMGVRLAGGYPVQLRPGHAMRPAELDAVVISGGHDVQPVLYKSAAEVQGDYDAERDRFESEIINQALADSVPILGICRGAQLLNVCLGGDLIQDLQRVHNDSRRRRTILPLKWVTLAKHSRLAGILGKNKLRVNSLHNQSIKNTGVGLKVAARDRRCVIQAVEKIEGRFCIGVQWHPEFLLYLRPARRLFRALVASARKSPESS